MGRSLLENRVGPLYLTHISKIFLLCAAAQTFTTACRRDSYERNKFDDRGETRSTRVGRYNAISRASKLARINARRKRPNVPYPELRIYLWRKISRGNGFLLFARHRDFLRDVYVDVASFSALWVRRSWDLNNALLFENWNLSNENCSLADASRIL